MDELLKQIQDSLRGMWERRWFGLLTAWIVGLAGAAVLLAIPDKYEASARVYVDTESTLRPLMQGLTVQPDLRQELELLSRVLINRPTVEKLIRSSDLDLKVTSPKAQEELVDHVMSTVTLASVDRGSNIWRIAYRDPDPNSAMRLVQALLSIFLESSAGNKRTDVEQAQRFIDEQIKVYENKLNEADSRLKDFRLKYLGLTGEGASDYVGQLTQLGDEIARARAEYQAAVQSRDALRREQMGEKPILLPDGSREGAVSTGIIPDLDARIDTLNKNLDELHRKYTDQHPDVISTKRLIQELEEERRKEIEERRKLGTAGMGPADSNPVYQQIKIAAANAEANVAAMGARLANLESRYQSLKERQKLVPEIEAERARLTRDYEVNKKNYDALVSRRESAVMSKQMQSVQGIGDFRVIDPPRVTPTPVSPNRLMLLPLVLLAALGAGVFVSLAVSQLWPTFHDTRSLRLATKRPILGAISVLRTPRLVAQQRRSFAMFAVGFSTLVLGYAIGIALMMVKSPVL